MAKRIGMKIEGEELFEHRKLLEKFQLNWVHQNGTSFTRIPNEQKLEIIAGDKWLDEMRPNLEEINHLSIWSYCKSFILFS